MKIRSEKKVASRSSEQVTCNLSDQTLYTVNLIEEDGTFTPAVCAVQSTFADCPEGVTSAHYSPGNGALFVIADGAAHYLEKGASSYVKMAENLGQRPFFADMYINTYAATILADGYNMHFYNGFGHGSTECVHRFYDGCEHCGRFFARDYSDGLRLWWAASHAVDWEEGINGSGYTFLPADGGAVLKLYSYKERLIAVRERGITVIHAYGDPQNYKVDATAGYLSAEGIIGESCAICDGRIFFCTAGGLYAFNGSGSERLASFTGGRLSSPAFAAACGDRYFAACNDKYLGDGRIYCYDASSGGGAVCDICPDALFCGPDGVYAVCGTSVKKLSRGGSGVWRSGKVRPGGARHAYLKQIELSCEGGADVTIVCDGVERSFSGGGPHTVNIGGHSFEFTVQAQGRLNAVRALAEV